MERSERTACSQVLDFLFTTTNDAPFILLAIVHLFSDIFSRDIISFVDREIATITALTNLGGVDPMLKGHFGIAFNLGVTKEQLLELLATVESLTGKHVEGAMEILENAAE
ncbi:MAG: carboxymuconolactone decarboxylase family protein [Saprospiraceae bacterium]